MDITVSLSIIALAAFIHSSFQLSVSVLTLLSGHTIGAKKSHAKLVKLTTSFILGVGTMTVLLLSTISLLLLQLFGPKPPQIVWASGCGLLVGLAFLVLLFYFRQEKGTTLWVPRSIAHYLTERTKATKLSAEAFGLGLSSVFGELLFIIAPLIISALVLIQLEPTWQLIGLSMYAIISLLTLIIIWVIVCKKHNISKVQRWREANKNFIQFISGTSLIILCFFVYAYEIIGSTIGGI